MKILVTGGTGFLGGHLTRALAAAGHEVLALGRSASQSALPPGVTPLAADLRDRAAVAAACAGADAVFHVGALSAPWGRRADFAAINVGGTAHVIAGCLAHGVGRLIFVSSPSVLFNGRDQLNLDDAAPYPARPISAYSATKRRAEELVRAAAERGLAGVIIRPKAIFGPGDTTLLPRLVAAARQGRLPQIGHGRNEVDLTYVENVVHALLLALGAPAAVGKTYAITNDEHIRLWEMIRAVLARVGVDRPLRTVPVGAAMLIARLMEARAALSGREPLLTRYTVAILARSQTYDIRAARRDLGYQPLVSVAEGLERTLSRE